MIVTCPACTTRYNFPEQRLNGDGFAITCATCGHGWIEGRAIEIVEIAPANLPATTGYAFEPDHEVKRLLEASKFAHAEFAVRRRLHLRRLRGWAVLATCLALPVVAAAAFPAKVVSVAPITYRAYEALGYNVNIYGLEVRRVEQEHAIADGARVLTIKGEIINVSASSQKIPWLRFGLRDEKSGEVYSWTLDSGARPLKAGESTSFVTRVAEPPETAKKVEIRFAHFDEIGSNTAP